MSMLARLRMLVLVLAAAALALLAIGAADRYGAVTDVSRSGRNSLDPASVAALGLVDGPLEIIAFVPQEPALVAGISDFVARYARHKDDLELSFVDPRTNIEAASRYGARLGELALVSGPRVERVTRLDEPSVTNAIARLARGGERFVTLLAANGERRAARSANHDISDFGAALQQRGLAVREFRPASGATIPDNTAVLVIASPSVAYAPGELDAINRYVAGGGNLLWLAEPDQPPGLAMLGTALGVTLLPGTIVDPVGLTKFRNPAYAIAIETEPHAALEGFATTVAFPYAAALLPTPNLGWEVTPLARTADEAWTETGKFEGNVGFDADDEVKGALNLALALTRTLGDGREQRVVVIGDGDFLSNTFVENLGNLEFARRLTEWLAADDALIELNVSAVPDANLELAMWQRLLVFLVFGAVVPLGLGANALLFWWRRRHA
ncbi:MAG: GldG family protein [Gammaproteobacteria bacterium]